MCPTSRTSRVIGCDGQEKSEPTDLQPSTRLQPRTPARRPHPFTRCRPLRECPQKQYHGSVASPPLQCCLRTRRRFQSPFPPLAEGDGAAHERRQGVAINLARLGAEGNGVGECRRPLVFAQIVSPAQPNHPVILVSTHHVHHSLCSWSAPSSNQNGETPAFQ